MLGKSQTVWALCFFFGVNENSRIDAWEGKSKPKNGKPVRIWALSSAQDIHGNIYTVDYWKSSSSGEYYPREIRYAENVISFTYCEDKPIPFDCDSKRGFAGYRDGSYVEDNTRINTITVKPSLGGENTYRFEYDESTIDGPRLKQLSVSGSAGTDRKQYKFQWGVGFQNFADLGVISVPDGLLQHSGNGWRIHLGDFNGDGRTYILRTSDDVSKNRLFPSNGKGFDDAGVISVPDGLLQHSGNGWRIHLGDFNGDGRTDILRTSDDVSKNRLFIARGQQSNAVLKSFSRISEGLPGYSRIDPSSFVDGRRIREIIEPGGASINIWYRTLSSFPDGTNYQTKCDEGAPGYISYVCGIPSPAPTNASLGASPLRQFPLRHRENGWSVNERP